MKPEMEKQDCTKETYWSRRRKNRRILGKEKKKELKKVKKKRLNLNGRGRVKAKLVGKKIEDC